MIDLSLDKLIAINEVMPGKYTVYKKGSRYYAKRNDGKIPYKSDDWHTVMNDVLGDLTTGRAQKEKVIVKGDIEINGRVNGVSDLILDMSRANVKQVANANLNDLLLFDTKTNVDIIVGVLDGNKQNQATPTSESNGHGIHLKDCDYFTIHVAKEIKNCPVYGIYGERCENITVTGKRITQCIKGIYFIGTRPAYMGGSGVFDLRNILIAMEEIDNGTAIVNVADAFGVKVRYAENVKVLSGIFHDFAQANNSWVGEGMILSQCKDFLVQGVICHANSENGVDFNACTGGTIRDVTAYENGQSAKEGSGIMLEDNDTLNLPLRDITIENCCVYNNGQNAGLANKSKVGLGIHMAISGSQNISVHGLKGWDDQEIETQVALIGLTGDELNNVRVEDCPVLDNEFTYGLIFIGETALKTGLYFRNGIGVQKIYVTTATVYYLRGKVTQPFYDDTDSTPNVHLLGARNSTAGGGQSTSATPTASKEYTVVCYDQLVWSTDSGNADNSITIKDENGATIKSGLSTLDAVLLKVGWTINWGAFTGTPPTVVVVGAC